jgi:hypothetical protein
VNQESGQWVELITGAAYVGTDSQLSVELDPYQVMWLKSQ